MTLGEGDLKMKLEFELANFHNFYYLLKVSVKESVSVNCTCHSSVFNPRDSGVLERHFLRTKLDYPGPRLQYVKNIALKT